jgi:hypothetical protein
VVGFSIWESIAKRKEQAMMKLNLICSYEVYRVSGIEWVLVVVNAVLIVGLVL